jgi:riboflavin kinase/FMN adenylyltransferase
METLHGIDGLTNLPPGAIISIGNFDGIHLGHQRILQTARKLASESRSSLAVVTFEPHPLTVLRPQAVPPRLTLPHRKATLLNEAGVSHLVILPPEPNVLNLSAEEFWLLLRDHVKPAHLVEGPSFNFGRGRAGTIEKLKEWSAQSTVKLHIVEGVEAVLLDLSIVPVSSSLVRWLIANGRARDASICLGRPYELEGKVIEGHKRGRKLGVPTANLDCADQLIPADGVYAGRCTHNGQTYAAAISIGTLPTFGNYQRQTEVHLINFSGDLYGQTLHVEVLDWLRDQLKFDGVESLKKQLHKDINLTKTTNTFFPSYPLPVLRERAG